MKNLSYLLGILLLASLLFAFYLMSEKSKLERVVYAQYTSELASSSERMTDLRNAVHQSLLFQDPVALQEELTTISRLSNEIKDSINKLPIDRATSTEWNAYLTRLGSAALNAKSEGGSTWSTDMQKAAVNIDELHRSWQDVASSFLTYDGNNKVWKDLQLNEGNSQFAENSKLVSSYREKDFPLTASESDAEKKRDLQFLIDKNITKDEAIQAFKLYFPEIGDATLNVSVNKDDAPYSFYHIQFVQGSRIGYADVTEKGGHVLSFLLERPISNKVKSHEAMEQAATEFLKEIGYKDIKLVESRENTSVWHYVFSRVTEDDVIVYPDSIQVKVAKDTGEVLGVNAMEYIQQETIPEQTVQPIDFKTFFQPSIEVVESRKIVTNDDKFQSRICYEVIAFNKDSDQHTYRIIIDGETHIVQQIELLS